jgi:hypothetical protein
LSLAADGPGSLLRVGNRVLAEARFEAGAVAGADPLRAAGAEVIHVSSRYQVVTVAVKPSDLHSVAGVAGVAGVSEVLTPIVSAVGPLAAASSCTGAATSEGDSQLGAANARAIFNLDGAGTTVGILSDSFGRDTGAPTTVAGDVSTGDLPGPGNPCGRSTPVRLLDDSYGKSDAADEGRAMAQIVHDLAPGSSLAFATAFTGLTAFADNIRRLAAPVSNGGAGANVIVDDVAYPEEPFFQDGPVAAAINEVSAAGVSYFSAAGNNNLIDSGGNNIASWEAKEFRNSTCPAELVALKAEHCMDFDPGAGTDPTFEVTVSSKATLSVDLQWAEPWNGVTSDLDVYALDSAGKPLEDESTKSKKFPVGSEEDNVGKTQRPVEFFQWENKTGSAQKVQLAIDRCFGTCNSNPKVDSLAKPRVKLVLFQNGGGVTSTEYPLSGGGDVVGPTIFGHNGAANAVSVGAIRFDTKSAPEKFSSRGPVTHLFGPVAGTTPAAKIPEQALAKPDLVATDGGANTFFGQFSAGIWRFFGTSAAAPHAAAVAALVREANPTLSAAQVRTALTSSARQVGKFGPDAVGAGLVDAYAAVNKIVLPPTVSITEPPPSLGNKRTPRIGFVANRPASFSCVVDGETPQPCTSPFVPKAPLSDGAHSFMVKATDLTGRTGSSEVAFRIDSRRPRTFFRRHPPRVIRTTHRRARAVFRFGSNEAKATFICRVDGSLFRFCGNRLAQRFPIGRHNVRVKARDEAGNIDHTPAVYRFRVKHRGS